MQKRVNLVFQGGGVKAIAYAGALMSMPSNVRPHRVAGTSAGAIVAAMLAREMSADSIVRELKKTQIGDFLEASEKERVKRLEQLYTGVLKVANGEGSYVKTIWKLWRAHRRSDIHEIWKQRGLYSTSLLAKWLNELFEDITFGELSSKKKVRDLMIVAADVAKAQYKIYSFDNTPNEKIADAVLASSSIPLFFRPYENRDICVDGGLLSNFPCYLFADSGYPTIGFRLRDLVEKDIELFNTAAYLKNLLHTMTEAHDKSRRTPKAYHEVPIKLEGIRATDFHLTEEQQGALLARGKEVGERVPWEEIATGKPEKVFRESRATHLLGTVIDNTERFYQELMKPEYRVDKLRDQVRYRARIDSQGNCHYQTEITYTVSGGNSLYVFGRSWRLTGRKGESFLDHIDTLTEKNLATGETKPLVWLPRTFNRTECGVLYFAFPPISEQSGPRTIASEFVARAEFAHVDSHNPQRIAFTRTRRAEDHVLDVDFEVLIARGQQLTAVPEWPSGKVAVSTAEIDGERYDIYRTEVKNQALQDGPTTFALRICPA